jgi:molybdate transport system substrate-binding protein
LLAVIVLLLAGCTAPATRGPAGDRPDERADSELVVYAASSLTEAFEAIAPLYERDGGKVRFSFESSSTLASQIVEGAPADVFASADRVQMGVVQGEGLAANPEPFATNRLVVITPADNPQGVERPKDLAQDGLKLVLGGPEVPVGVYAREMLRRLGVVERAEANVVSNEEDVKAVVSKVRLGEADAGVVYRTDVTSEVEVDLQVIEVPPPTSPLAVYPIAALAQAPNPAGAREFVDLVASKAGARVLRRFGFGLR